MVVVVALTHHSQATLLKISQFRKHVIVLHPLFYQDGFGKTKNAIHLCQLSPLSTTFTYMYNLTISSNDLLMYFIDSFGRSFGSTSHGGISLHVLLYVYMRIRES